MIFPKLNSPRFTESTISAFGGIDKTPVCPENFFFDTQNTSSALFPLLSTREKRLRLAVLEQAPSALHTVNGITYVTGKSLYYNGVLQYDGLTAYDKKQIVSMGSKIIIFPDGYYINTLEVDENGVCADKGELTNSVTLVDTIVLLKPCIADKPFPVYSQNAPISPEDNTLWLDTSTEPHQLKEYSADTSSWNIITATHYSIEINKINENFNVGDIVQISGLREDLDGVTTVDALQANSIIVQGNLTDMTVQFIKQDTPFTVKQLLPKMDFVCEHQNRLFGCRYGLNNQGQFVNEIYSSKLGDPAKWYDYKGLSTDSYAASCGSEGKWTGIISHMGYVVFFKENRIHRLFGTKPANFTLYEDAYIGVKEGSESSLCLHNGTLYYHAENGIYSYSGSTPVLISKSLGTEKFLNAASAFGNNRLFICMTDSNGERQLYSYDTQKSLWHREDCSDFVCLSEIDGNVLGIKNTGGSHTLELLLSSDIPEICQKLYSATTEKENAFEWFAESGNIGLSFDDCKYLNKLKVRFEADAGSSVQLYFQLDSSNIWEECGSLTSSALGSYALYFLPPRCDHLRLRIEGRGACRIYSLTKTFEIVGEVM